jgi:hypothetical protein
MDVPVDGGSPTLQCNGLILVLPPYRVMLHPRHRAHEYSGSEPAADGFSAFTPATSTFSQPDSTFVGKSRHAGSATPMLHASPELHGTPARLG